MKKIFIPLPINYWTNATKIPLDGAEETYFKKIIKYDLIPVMITPLLSLDQVRDLYDMCDGAYYLGGEDINPSWYHQVPNPQTFTREEKRDDIEIPFLRQILTDKKPFIGVCRGSQVLAVASGGSLIQHIPDITDEPHYNPRAVEFSHLYDGLDDLYTTPKHEVEIDQESNVYALLKRRSVMVNSGHHQAIDNPGENMRIVGRSPKGITEIIEHYDPSYFCIGVQSHPEIEDDSFFEKLFEEFARTVHNG